MRLIKRVYVLIFLIVLIVAPLVMVHSITTRVAQDEMSAEVKADLERLDFEKQIEPEIDLDLSTMIFSPTASQEEGIFYVLRRGVDPIAYFGISTVYYLFDGTYFTLEFLGSNEVIPKCEMPSGSVTNYFYGADSSQWKTGLNDYTQLRFNELYSGIDLVYKFQNGNIKYEFIVKPEADPSEIRMLYSDADSVIVRPNDVVVSKDQHKMADTDLSVFQNDGDYRISAEFKSTGYNELAVNVGDYDSSTELVIDPVILAYSTYLGGDSNDYGQDIAVEDEYVYVTGWTVSDNFPTINPKDPFRDATDCFVSKYTVDGQSLVYSTFLGGTSDDYAKGIAVEFGCVYIIGETFSSDFPLENANDSTIADQECFVTKFAADGQSLIYSTYLGGDLIDTGEDIAVENRLAVVTGYTMSSNFPIANANDSLLDGSSDCFVTLFSADGQTLIYSTFLGNSSHEVGYGIAMENGYAYVAGLTLSPDFPTVNAYDSSYNGDYDCFVTKMSSDGKSLVYSTYLGDENHDECQGIAVEDAYAYVTGFTTSSNFPTYNAYNSTHGGLEEGFVTKLDTDGSSLIYSTFLGGADRDHGYAIAVENGSAYITGRTVSVDFPNEKAYDITHNGNIDCFITMLEADGQSLGYSTFLGGSVVDVSYGIAVENGYAHITGQTNSVDFPIILANDCTPNGLVDCFVAMFCLDSDSDGLSDFHEKSIGTHPDFIDTDNDNFLDGYEVEYGSNPLDPMSYPAIPQAWYDAIYEDLDGNSTLIQNLISWVDGNSSLLLDVMQQLEDNATLLTHVISWLDGNHSAIETLFTQLEGNATLLEKTVNALNGNSSLIENLVSWCNGNSSILLDMIQQLEANATLLQQVISWLDGNHTAIETLFSHLNGNATLLLATVNSLNGNATYIQNLLTWSAGNETLLLNLIDQVNSLDPTNITQVVEWLNGNHTQIERLLTYVEGNATLLLQTVNALNGNATRLDLIAALATANIEWLQELNSTVIGNLTEIREVLDQLGVTVGDSDYDGLDDLDEIAEGTDILCIDTDCDNLNDAFEIKIGTDPLDEDSDGDTYLDGAEVLAGTDPLDINDYPGAITTTPSTTTTTTTTTTTSVTDVPSPLMIVILVAGIGGGIAVIIVIIFIIKKKRARS